MSATVVERPEAGDHRVVALTEAGVREDVHAFALSRGLAVNEFIERAEAEELDDAARDYWMMIRHALR